jgi:hypothetical protein
VVALDQDLAAAADAHQIVANAAVTGLRVVGAQHGEAEEANEEELERTFPRAGNAGSGSFACGEG